MRNCFCLWNIFVANNRKCQDKNTIVNKRRTNLITKIASRSRYAALSLGLLLTLSLVCGMQIFVAHAQENSIGCTMPNITVTVAENGIEKIDKVVIKKQF